MEINQRPPGLISRRMFRIDDGTIVVQEDWNIDVPRCPMIRSPFHGQPGNSGPLYIRLIEMTDAEYRNANVTLFNGQ